MGMARDGIDPKVVERIKQLIVYNPFIGITDLKAKAKVDDREVLDMHLEEVGKDPLYKHDLRKWKSNVNFKQRKEAGTKRKEPADTSPRMKRKPHVK